MSDDRVSGTYVDVKNGRRFDVAPTDEQFLFYVSWTRDDDVLESVTWSEAIIDDLTRLGAWKREDERGRDGGA